MQASSFEKAWFFLSALVLAFGYGYASHAWEWFPHGYVQQAWKQTRNMMGRPGTPKVYNRSGAHIERPGQIQPGLTLITSSWRQEEGSLKPGAKLIDATGNTVHTWQPSPSDLFKGPGMKGRDPTSTVYHGSHLLPNGDLLLNLSRVGLVRLDACGRVEWRVKEGNHHSIERADNGSFWTPGTSAERHSSTAQYPNGFPGINRPVWLERMINVSSDGRVLQRINVLDVMYQNGLERYISKVDQPQAGTEGPISITDISHLNDVEPLSSSMADEYPLFEAGDLLVSLRNLDLVFVFDPDTQVVKWHSSESFIQQHDPDFTGEGWIGVFDNNEDFTKRGRMLGGSRIVAIQPHTDSTIVRFPTKHAEPFYTPIRGKWQALSNGNLLLTESNAGRVVEVLPNGKTAWEWIHKPISDSRVAPVMGATRHDLTRSDVASWRCSSVDSMAQSPSPNPQ